MGDAGSLRGQRDIHWEVYPITENSPAQVSISGAVTTGEDMVNIFSAKIEYSGGTPATTEETGNWISTIDDDGTGDMGLNFVAGSFTEPPRCFCTVNAASSVTGSCSMNTVTSTTAEVDVLNHADPQVAQDYDIAVMCMGK
jgi:hypothetical protein